MKLINILYYFAMSFIFVGGCFQFVSGIISNDWLRIFLSCLNFAIVLFEINKIKKIESRKIKIK